MAIKALQAVAQVDALGIELAGLPAFLEAACGGPPQPNQADHPAYHFDDGSWLLFRDDMAAKGRYTLDAYAMYSRSGNKSTCVRVARLRRMIDGSTHMAKHLCQPKAN